MVSSLCSQPPFSVRVQKQPLMRGLDHRTFHFMLSFPRIASIVFALGLSWASTNAFAADAAPIIISATDQMKFDTTDITGKVGEKLTIHLINDGSMPKEAMAHNIVVLKPGTDETAFVASANKHAENGYLPGDDQAEHMIIHTKLLGPGDEDTISFTPLAPGVYAYVCTFPGHAAAGMRGQITVQ